VLLEPKLSSRTYAEGEETADLIRETGAECLFVKSDVSSEADVREGAETIATYGKLDCAFNNAGIDLVARCMNNRSRILTRSCRSTREGYFCMKYEIQQMLKGAGAIVNNSSTNGRCASGDLSLCCQQTRSDGADAIGGSRLCQTGIRINAVNPGPTDLIMA